MKMTPEKIESFQNLYDCHAERVNHYNQNKVALKRVLTGKEVQQKEHSIAVANLMFYDGRAYLTNYTLPEEYISKRDFIPYVLELLSGYSTSKGRAKVAEYTHYSFDPEQFRGEFRERVYVYLRTPFFKQLADEILAAANIKKIISVLDEYEDYEKSDLILHYKKEENKEYYRGKEVKTHFLKSDFNFIKNSLHVCIKKAINDPDFPEIKQKLEEEQKERQRKLEEEQKERQRKLEEEQKEFWTSYKEWQEKQKELASRMINNYSKSDHMLSRKKFFIIYLLYNSRWKKAQPELDKHILDSLSSSLKEDSATLKEIELALVNAISSSIDVPNEIVFRNWQKNRNFPDYYPIVSAVTGEVSKVSTYDIIEAYLGWYAEVAGAVDALKTPKKQYITQKLLDGMKDLLSSRKKLAFLYAPFEEFVLYFNKKYVQSRELSYAWRESLCRGIMNAKNIESAFAEELSSKKAISVEGLRNTLNGLAGVDTLQVIFQSALRPPVRSYALRKGPNLKLPVSFSDGTNLLITIQTKIQKFKDKKGKEVPYVTVQEEGVSCTISESGNKGFDYEIKDLLISDYEHTDGTVYVDYEYTIALRGQRNDQTTSEETYEENTTGKEESKSETETSSTSHSLSIGKTVGVDILFGSAESNIDYTFELTTGREVSVSSAFMSSQLQGKSQGRSVTAHGGVEALAFTINARLKSSNIGSETLDVESAQTVDRLRRGEQTIIFPASIKQAGLNWKR